MHWPAFLEALPDGCRLRLKVQPRASRNEVLADSASAELRIRVTAPPVDSAANEAVLELLAETLKCRRGAVTLVRGQASRQKVVLVSGLTASQVAARLGLDEVGDPRETPGAKPGTRPRAT